MREAKSANAEYMTINTPTELWDLVRDRKCDG